MDLDISLLDLARYCMLGCGQRSTVLGDILRSDTQVEPKALNLLDLFEFGFKLEWEISIGIWKSLFHIDAQMVG